MKYENIKDVVVGDEVVWEDKAKGKDFVLNEIGHILVSEVAGEPYTVIAYFRHMQPPITYIDIAGLKVINFIPTWPNGNRRYYDEVRQAWRSG